MFAEMTMKIVVIKINVKQKNEYYSNNNNESNRNNSKNNKVKTVRWQSRHTSLSVNISETTLIIKKIKVTSVAI